MKPLLLAAALSMLGATAAPADPSPQLVATVEARLPRYNLEADVSQFDTPTVVQLFSALNQPEDDWFATRRRLKAILRNAVYLDR